MSYLQTSLDSLLAQALDAGGGSLPDLAQRPAGSARDRALTLLRIYDLHTAPLTVVGEAARFQGHPVVAAVKSRLEAQWLTELELVWSAQQELAGLDTASGAVAGLRAVAAKDRLPKAYRWLAGEATWPELVGFLALEGGPDGGFDDLVAACQIGLHGSAKLELAKNFWDEMGNGDQAAVHTVLHDRLVAALDLPRIPRADQPLAALERAALTGLLATNRYLQPELIGALGLLELQAGPRCRLVLTAFDRLGAPSEAYPFYREHAEVDPVHGKDWTEKAVVPLVTELPHWGPRIVKGAGWRSTVNLAFFHAVHDDLVTPARAA